MENERFQLGSAYYANSVFKGSPQRLAIPIGRYGRKSQFAFVDELGEGEVYEIEGREFVTVKTASGEYTISSTCCAQACEAARVTEMLSYWRKRYAVRTA